MASADDLVKPVVFAADATLAGGARAEVCVRLLNVESSSSQPEALDHWRAGEDIIVEIPEGGSLDAWTKKDVIGLAVRVEVCHTDHFPVSC